MRREHYSKSFETKRQGNNFQNRLQLAEKEGRRDSSFLQKHPGRIQYVGCSVTKGLHKLSQRWGLRQANTLCPSNPQHSVPGPMTVDVFDSKFGLQAVVAWEQFIVKQWQSHGQSFTHQSQQKSLDELVEACRQGSMTSSRSLPVYWMKGLFSGLYKCTYRSLRPSLCVQAIVLRGYLPRREKCGQYTSFQAQFEVSTINISAN